MIKFDDVFFVTSSEEYCRYSAIKPYSHTGIGLREYRLNTCIFTRYIGGAQPLI